MFHIEGFVNQYVLEPQDATTLVFDSEAIENIPPGYTARESLHLKAPGRLEEVFELAGPGQPLAEYTRNRLVLID